MELPLATLPGTARTLQRKVKVGLLMTLLLLWSCHSAEFASEDGTTMMEVMGYMSKYGYVSQASASSLTSPDQIKEGLKMVQRIAGLPVTGELDDKTALFIKRPRCGVSDKNLVEALKWEAEQGRPRPVAGRRPGRTTSRHKRYVLYPNGYRWNKDRVTWRLDEDSRKVRRDTVRSEFQRAFRLWSDATNLDFSELAPGSRETPDIVVQFASGFHNDGRHNSFDGQGNTLAHAFPPTGRTALAGDLHMDDDENWDVHENIPTNSVERTSIFTVATHELGHSLGLEHSPDETAIMYAAYMGAKDYDSLPLDDERGIQALYGRRSSIGQGTAQAPQPPRTRPPLPPPRWYPPTTITTAAPPTRTPIPDAPDICHVTRFDAIAAIRGELHFFKDKYMWRLMSDEELFGPMLIKSFWQGLPDDVQRIDAAYEKPTGQYEMVLFSGNRYWIFSDIARAQGPWNLQSIGLPSRLSKLDAILVWGHNGSTYFFKDNLYWKLEENHHTVRERDYPKSIESWEGVSYPLTAAVRWKDGKTYFFKDDVFWIFNDVTMRTEQPARFINKHFFDRCAGQGLRLTTTGIVPSLTVVLCWIVVWSRDL